MFGVRKRRVNIKKWLESSKGGRWRYDGTSQWMCDDGIRRVSRVSMGFSEDHNETGYCLYGNDKPEWIFL